MAGHSIADTVDFPRLRALLRSSDTSLSQICILKMTAHACIAVRPQVFLLVDETRVVVSRDLSTVTAAVP